MYSDALRFLRESTEEPAGFAPKWLIWQKYIVVNGFLKDTNRGGRYLLGGCAHEFEFEEYDPLSQAKIWIEFATLEPEEHAIVQFASKYGRLGGEIGRNINSNDLPENFTPEFCWREDRDRALLTDFIAESIDSWIEEIKKIKPLFEFWELLGNGEYIKLSEKIKFSQDYSSGAFFDGDFLHRRGRGKQRFVSTFEYGRPGNVELATRVLLHEEIAEEIKSHTSAMMIWEDNQSKIVFALSNLIGVIWFQFAQALEGRTEFKRCAACGNWIALRPGSRRDRRYCDGACRVKAHEQRKQNVTNP